METNKKKILFLGRFPPPVHGAAVMNEFYYNSLDINENFEIRRVQINRKASFEEIGQISLRNLLWFLRSYLLLLTELILFRPNLIYFEIAPNGGAFYRDSFYVLLCKLFNKKIIFHLHARNLEKNSYSRLVFRNTKMILLSKILLKELDGLFEKKDVHFLANGIPDFLKDGKFQEILKKKSKNKELKIVFLSNMIPEKGTIDLLNICGYLKERKVRFKAIFAGSWPNQKIKEDWYLTRNSLGLENYCFYVGEKYDEEKRNLLSESNVLVFPTSYKNESFPLVILEAFMFGIPAIVYDNGAIKEMVSKDYLGSVFSIGNWKEMAKKLEKMKFNEKNSKRIREDFKKRYTILTSEKGLLKIFKEETK